MREAATYLVGEHDFVALATKGSPRDSTIRTILRLEIQTFFNEIRIDVEGNGFLYNMVRNIAGTLLEVGRGHWMPDRIPRILESRDRSQAGPTAPARGLCLQWVKYPPEKFCREAIGEDQESQPSESGTAKADSENEGSAA